MANSINCLIFKYFGVCCSIKFSNNVNSRKSTIHCYDRRLNNKSTMVLHYCTTKYRNPVHSYSYRICFLFTSCE